MLGTRVPEETPDDLFAEAERLDAQGLRAGQETQAGREFRAQAAALKVKALGTRVYPVLICSGCYAVTGWTGPEGKCDACLRAASLHAAFADPHAGWVNVGDRRPAGPTAARKPLRERLSALAGRGAASNRSWLTRVEPGGTGPAAPEQGYELEAARRDEVPAVDGSGMIVRFTTCTYRFGPTDWVPLGTTRMAHGATHVPAEFSAALPIVQLAEAWGDFRGAVDAYNAGAWAQESTTREAARASRQERGDALRDQQHVADLLDET